MKRARLNSDPLDKAKAYLTTLSDHYHPRIQHVIDDNRYISKLAKFNIMRAAFHMGFDYEACVSRWLLESQIVRKFHEDAEAQFPNNPISQSIYFVAHVQYLLLYQKPTGERAEDVRAVCEYDLVGGSNFIVSLLQTNRCYCTCYASYTQACAEEFGYDAVYMCPIPGHVFNMVCDDFSASHPVPVAAFDASGEIVSYHEMPEYLDMFNAKNAEKHKVRWIENIDMAQEVISQLKFFHRNFASDLSYKGFTRNSSIIEIGCQQELNWHWDKLPILINAAMRYRNAVSSLMMLGMLFDMEPIFQQLFLGFAATRLYQFKLYELITIKQSLSELQNQAHDAVSKITEMPKMGSDKFVAFLTQCTYILSKDISTLQDIHKLVGRELPSNVNRLFLSLFDRITEMTDFEKMEGLYSIGDAVVLRVIRNNMRIFCSDNIGHIAQCLEDVYFRSQSHDFDIAHTSSMRVFHDHITLSNPEPDFQLVKGLQNWVVVLWNEHVSCAEITAAEHAHPDFFGKLLCNEKFVFVEPAVMHYKLRLVSESQCQAMDAHGSRCLQFGHAFRFSSLDCLQYCQEHFRDIFTRVLRLLIFGSIMDLRELIIRKQSRTNENWEHVIYDSELPIVPEYQHVHKFNLRENTILSFVRSHPAHELSSREEIISEWFDNEPRTMEPIEYKIECVFLVADELLKEKMSYLQFEESGKQIRFESGFYRIANTVHFELYCRSTDPAQL